MAWQLQNRLTTIKNNLNTSDCHKIEETKMGRLKNSGFPNIFGAGAMDDESEFLPIIADGDDKEADPVAVPDARHADRSPRR